MVNIEEQELENNKSLVRETVYHDGRLFSPIDLCLEDTTPLHLDKLKWVHLDEPPIRMKMNNTGETVIVSGKWADERPYMTGGPLDGNYVFSQIHFHWGSEEDEGSEHTIQGDCYPLEMHVVFYKSRYLTQEAALKKDDGIIIAVYLMKEKTTPFLKWLTTRLPKIVEPHTSTVLPLTPLSALLVPFTEDYLLYWGSLVSQRCSHTTLWFVSRAALSITVHDLNMFRQLLNSRKEAMNKNFRGASSAQDRTVFHINPSQEKKHLLLPGTVDPPGQALIVNFTQLPALDQAQAERLFSRGDCNKELSTDISTSTANSPKEMISCTKTYVLGEGATQIFVKKDSFKEENEFPSGPNDLSSIKIGKSGPVGGRKKRNASYSGGDVRLKKSQWKIKVEKRKSLESNRRLEVEKNKENTKKKNNVASDQKEPKLKRLQKCYISNVNKVVFTEKCKTPQKHEPCIKKDKAKTLEGENKQGTLCVHQVTTPLLNHKIHTKSQGIEKSEIDKENTKTPNLTSKLPIRNQTKRQGLKSTLARYFDDKERAATAPQTLQSSPEKMEFSGRPAAINKHPKPMPFKPHSLTTSIPKPIGRDCFSTK